MADTTEALTDGIDDVRQVEQLKYRYLRQNLTADLVAFLSRPTTRDRGHR